MTPVGKTSPTVLTEIAKREKKIKDNKLMRLRPQRSEEQMFCPEIREKGKHLGRCGDRRSLLPQPPRAARGAEEAAHFCPPSGGFWKNCGKADATGMAQSTGVVPPALLSVT